MTERSSKTQAIGHLQQLGLKEYEAKSFVALARREQGTAKDISDISDVPRTRVYDAIRVLESKGLVETQHSNPQVFRAVSIDEAINTIQAEFIERTESLRTALRAIEPADEPTTDVTHEVWTISGDRGISSRTQQLVEGATEEVVLVIGHESLFTEQLADQLRDVQQRGVTVIVGTVDGALRREIEESLPDVDVFVSGLEWLSGSSLRADETKISRLLLVDREAILVSSFTGTGNDGRQHEQAVFGRGFDNGFVAIVRRIMATGLQLESGSRGDTN